MKKYHVKLEASTVWGKDVEIEAESMDEAVKIAKEKHCAKEQVEVSYHPTCVEPKPADADKDYEVYEYNHEIYGECDDCKVTLFNDHENHPDNDWPWQHDAGDTGHHTYVCYPCAMKRKEAGNYCGFYSHYYRDDHHHGCDSCPVGDCSKAQERYYRNVKAQLKDARDYYCQQSNKEFAEFLENNELGLAYDILASIAEEKGDAHIQLKAAKMLMDEGWW